MRFAAASLFFCAAAWAEVLSEPDACHDCDAPAALPVSDGEAEAEAEADLLRVSLLQTGLTVGGRKRLASVDLSATGAVERAAEALKAGSPQAGSVLTAKGDLEVHNVAPTAPAASSQDIRELPPAEQPTAAKQAPHHVTRQCSELELPLPGLLQFQLQLGTLQAAGFPAEAPCSVAAAVTGAEDASTRGAAPSLLQAAREHLAATIPDEMSVRLILGIYLALYVVSISTMTYYMATAGSSQAKKGFVDNEETTWKKGLMDWFAVAWATPWVARWGHSFNASLTKIRPGELPDLGDAKTQAAGCTARFEQLWRDEIQKVGVEKASVVRVLMRLWTNRAIFQMWFILFLQTTGESLYAVFLTRYSLMYFHDYQQEIALHPEVSRNMAVPILVSILAFSFLNCSNIILNSFGNSISIRTDQQMIGALSVALFRKSQRLPSSALKGTGGTTPSSKSGSVFEAPTADLMTLVNYDIGQNLTSCLTAVCMAINSFLTISVLTYLLWSKLKLATLFAIGSAFVMTFIMLSMGAGYAQSLAKLQEMMDKRVAAVREVLFGIRVAKYYAWEEAMEEKLGQLRREEVTLIEKFFNYMGIFRALFVVFPRLLVLSGLWGYAILYGHQDVAAIFTCMQILSSLKGCCDMFTVSVNRIVCIMPSIARIEGFLKQPEAPVPVDGQLPEWVSIWPKSPADPANCTLVLEGAFRWSPDQEPALRNLKLEVPKGELVAILGEVGSGKSTLLHAVLGELYPDKIAGGRLSRSKAVAYCSQVAHIAEGTVRDNILFGQAYDEARYSNALMSASLEQDLKVLPGGDLCPVGGRGITLSGGQRARVALARAAYHQESDMAVLDDPFAAVDAPTAMVILDNLLLGPLMKDRTRLVVMQPDAERLKRFDRMLIMDGGRIVEQGTPEVVMTTQAYKRLLSSHVTEFQGEEADGRHQTPTKGKKEEVGLANASLREEEFEGRPTWEVVKQYCSLGRWRNLLNCSLIYFLSVFMLMLADIVLARWTNAIDAKGDVNDHIYLSGHLLWIVAAIALWFVSWKFGEWFTLRISGQIHGMLLYKLLRAPIDKFYDKHPVGRIMNRMSTDLAVVDLTLFGAIAGTSAVLYHTMVPLLYVHMMLPWFATVLALPFYYLVSNFVGRYWNTIVPVRYALASVKSEANGAMGDVQNDAVTLRAYRDTERLSQLWCDIVDNSIKIGCLSERVLKRWLVNRLVYLWSFVITSTYIMGLLYPEYVLPGTMGLFVSSLLVLGVMIEPNLDAATGAQFELISLARLHEYLSIPQEKPRKNQGDSKYGNFSARILRNKLSQLTYFDGGEVVEVRSLGQPLLQAAKGATTLALSGGRLLRDLCPGCPELEKAHGWHRIVAVNDCVRDAQAMAQELCRSEKEAGAGEVLIEVQSGWLLDGARVQIENLKAGYADIPRDVLRGVSMTFEAKTKVGVCGTTGCGKSSLLLVLLRVLEPRAGRVVINGVDTRELGLATLRSCLGLVPQDPVLYSGTLRHNLDPCRQFSKGRIWEAIRCASLSALVESWPMKLDHLIADGGGNLSFGQRQLVCIARMILRQPALLLLDEATSAIDPATQETVQRTIHSAFPSSTLVAVAHRLETVLDFDRIVVLDRGEVAEEGSVKELSERKDGLLRKMLNAKGAW